MQRRRPKRSVLKLQRRSRKLARKHRLGQDIELYSAQYYADCIFGQLLACGLTHTAVTPLNLIKCGQVDSKIALYLAASASAESNAVVALGPSEAVKVRMQTTIPSFATGTFNGISSITGK
ncbi:hypothetical protein PZA11_000595 [Diplocarpon coronariae]